VVHSIAPKFFVFPLPSMVMFPLTTKPLNIFEPRYIKMVNDALESNSVIALSLIRSGRLRWPMYETVVGAGRPMLLERRNDGSMLIIMECVGRARIGSAVHSDEPYLIHEGEWLPEDEELTQENLFLLNRLYKSFVHWLQFNVEDSERLSLFLSQLVSMQMKVNYMCALMVQSPEAQQELLEIDDINERLNILGFTLEAQSQRSPELARTGMEI
jgi:Lon protease-like protein